MISVSISISPEAARALDPAQYVQALDATVHAAAESLRNRIAVYPGPSHQPVIWRIPQARVAYLAIRRRAGLPAKYTRQSDPMSQRLGPSWAVRKIGQGHYAVGTRVTYAAQVQSAAHQEPQHAATGWKTDVQAVDELMRSGDIERAGAQAVAHLTR